MNIAKLLLSWGMVLSYVVLNSAGALLIKYRILQLGETHFHSFESFTRYFARLMTSYEVIGGFGAIFLSALAWMIALSKMDLSVAYPVGIGLNFLIIVSTAVLVYDEVLSTNKIIGIVLLLLGLIFASRS